VIARLRLGAGTKGPISKAAGFLGDLRRKQGYTVAMLVDEARLLQGTIFFNTPQKREEFGIQRAAFQRSNNCGRRGCAIEGAGLRFMAADGPKGN
jgi:hypothetical protein